MGLDGGRLLQFFPGGSEEIVKTPELVWTWDSQLTPSSATSNRCSYYCCRGMHRLKRKREENKTRAARAREPSTNTKKQSCFH